MFFQNNTDLFLTVREKVLNNFRDKLFPTKHLYKIPIPKLELEPELEL